jgi:cytochrome c oxidase subunit I
MATISELKTNPASFTPKRSKGQIIVDWLTTTDHKKIGYLYLITSFIYFLIGGVMALVIRAQLALPGLEIVHPKSSTTSSSQCTAPSCF